MSRAFINEDAREELPVIPERAPLPAGSVNYVTPTGMEQLLAERGQLEAERAALLAQPDDRDRRAKLHVTSGKLAQLAERIASARVIVLADQPQDEVRFGATVTIETLSGERVGARRTVQIVGVDEASAAEGRIAFTSPLAKALLGKQEGDMILFNTPAAAEEMEISEIRYL